VTELQEAELTDGQGRALSTHKTHKSYEGHAKRTAKRMLSVTRKRHAHRLANETVTDVQNEASEAVQNENEGKQKSA
jgi:3-polyprenyl-4-hydroxybenzoate decarboxylase